MNQEIKQRWIEALRSGEYKQGKKCLHAIDGSFCCLGVLCDIHAKENSREWNTEYVQDGIDDDHTAIAYGTDFDILPVEVMLWAALSTMQATLPRSIHHGKISGSSLSYLNDAGLTFEQIANAIEEQL